MFTRTSLAPSLEDPNPRRPLRVLLVDDQASTRLAVQLLLRHMACETDAVSNGREALEIMERREYDVVLMDLMMPEMGGLEAVRRLRQIPTRGPRPRVIAVTADDTPEDRETCLAAGMDDLVAKPLTCGRLIEALRRDQLLDPSLGGM